MFGLQVFTYFLFSFNARALAQGRVSWTVVSDLIYAANSYWFLRRIVKNECGYGLAGFILGGALGSAFAIYATKFIFGQ